MADDDRTIAGALLTRGEAGYRRDVQAIVGWPPGTHYHARWPTAAVHEAVDVDALHGAWVVICLVERTTRGVPERVIPMRLARVKKVQVVWGAHELATMAPAFQLKLLLGPWPKKERDRDQVPRLLEGGAVSFQEAGTTIDAPGDIAAAIEDSGALVRDPATKRVRSWVVRAPLGSHPVDYSAGSWSEIAAAVVQTRAHRATPLATMTSFRPAAPRDTHYHEPRWFHETGDQVLDLSTEVLSGRFPSQRRGAYVVRAGRPYTIRVMLCLPNVAQGDDLGPAAYGLTSSDPALTTLPAPQIVHPGLFELVDLPFIASANRLRRTVLELGPQGEAPGVLRLPRLALALEILPPWSARFMQLVGATLVGAAATASFAGVDPRITVPLASAGIALLGATILRPER